MTTPAQRESVARKLYEADGIANVFNGRDIEPYLRRADEIIAAHVDASGISAAGDAAKEYRRGVDTATVAKRAVNGNPSVSIVAGKKSSIVRIFGAAAVTCTVWSRSGNE